jgi:hypothetical protein
MGALVMDEFHTVCCPDCGGEIVDARSHIELFDEDTQFIGFRCVKCERGFTGAEIIALINSDSE